MEAADELSSSGRQENQELIESVNKEKAKVALARERQQLKRQAEAIQVARQQLVKSMDRGQELEDLRTKAEALEAEADALRRERAALETQRRRIQAEAEDIAEEREILEQEAKKIHRAVSSDNRAAQDKDLLESLRAAERQLAQQTAEFRNFKWRVESESKAAEQRALAKAAKPLLLGVLETEFSVHPMPNAVGKAFDPQLHEAISLRDDQVGPDVVVEQLEEGFLFGDSSQAKVKHHSLEPAFHATFHSWLKKHKLETCFKLLDQRGVIVSILKGDPVEANAAVGLPTRFAEKLWKAWCSDGDLRLLRPLCSPPDDWEAVFSRNVGLFYFCKRVVHGPAQWMYPPTLAEDTWTT
eukprot:g26137.t1